MQTDNGGYWDGTTFTEDGNSLLIDPLGDLTQLGGYSASDPDYDALDSSDDDFLIDIDDDTPDASTPTSKLQFKLRIRLRKLRIHVRSTTPADWIDIRQRYHDGPLQQATGELLALWVAQTLGFVPPSPQ